MKMKHGTSEQWLAYVGHELPDEESDELEKHLESCEACMELYIQSVELAVDSYPMLQSEAALADSVMDAIHAGGHSRPTVSLSVVEGASSTRKWLSLGAWTRHPIFHYTVAAAITMILMSSGLFQSLAEGRGQVDPLSPEFKQVEPPNEHLSVSQQLLDKTIVMLDSIQPKHERGGIR
jgi:anti-sigma factor RsiW